MTPVYAALAVAGGTLVATYLTLGRGVRYSRRALYAMLRAGALGLIALVLLRPEHVTESEITRRRTLAVLVDNSRSMSLPVSPGSAYSRAAKLEGILDSSRVELDALRSRYELAVYEFDREARRVMPAGEGAPAITAPGGTGEATALGRALVQVLDQHRGGRLAGILVLSDGASNLGITNEEAARACAAAGTPVHAIAIGEGRELADLSVEALDAPPRARAGAPVQLAARIRAVGIRHRRRAVVTIRAGGREIERREVTLAGGASPLEVRASFTPRSAGTLAVEAEVAAFTGEAVTANNVRMTFVEVEHTSVRVLYIEGVLRLDFKALRRALGAAGGLELDLVRAFLRRPAADEGAGGGSPEHTEDLRGIRLPEYDVFVVGELGGELGPGRLRPAPPGPDSTPGALPLSILGEIDRLVREDGRGLVVFSGPRALVRSDREASPLGPLAKTLPVEITDPGPSGPSRVRPTAAGGNHPALGIAPPGAETPRLWPALCPLDDLPEGARVKRGCSALLAAEGDVPVLVVSGRGARVAAFLCGKTHVWKDNPRAPRGAYERLVRSIVAWAAGRESSNALVSVELGRHRLYRGDEVTLTARVNRARAREAGFSNGEIDRIELAARIEGPLPGSGEGGPGSPGIPEGGEAPAETVRLRRLGAAYTGTVRARTGGVFRVLVRPASRDARIAPAETKFVVETDRREFRSLAAEPAALRGLAEATGGLFTGADDPDAVLRPLLRAPAGKATLVHRSEAAWDRAWVGLLFMGALFLEWWMRRR